MPKFQIDLYELHKSSYTVEADTPALAIIKMQEMDCEYIPDSLVYLRTMDEGSYQDLDYAFPGLVKELDTLGFDMNYDECNIYEMKLIK